MISPGSILFAFSGAGIVSLSHNRTPLISTLGDISLSPRHLENLDSPGPVMDSRRYQHWVQFQPGVTYLSSLEAALFEGNDPGDVPIEHQAPFQTQRAQRYFGSGFELGSRTIFEGIAIYELDFPSTPYVFQGVVTNNGKKALEIKINNTTYSVGPAELREFEISESGDSFKIWVEAPDHKIDMTWWGFQVYQGATPRVFSLPENGDSVFRTNGFLPPAFSWINLIRVGTSKPVVLFQQYVGSFSGDGALDSITWDDPGAWGDIANWETLDTHNSVILFYAPGLGFIFIAPNGASTEVSNFQPPQSGDTLQGALALSVGQGVITWGWVSGSDYYSMEHEFTEWTNNTLGDLYIGSANGWSTGEIGFSDIIVSSKLFDQESILDILETQNFQVKP